MSDDAAVTTRECVEAVWATLVRVSLLLVVGFAFMLALAAYTEAAPEKAAQFAESLVVFEVAGVALTPFDPFLLILMVWPFTAMWSVAYRIQDDFWHGNTEETA